MTNWEMNEIDQRIIKIALEEDLNVVFCDVTTDLLLSNYNHVGYGKIISKHPEPIIFAGIPIIRAILDEFQQPYSLNCHYDDGEEIPSQATICEIEADGHVLLMAERTILNFIRHLSAVATIARKFVNLASPYHTQILDTRKTTPGFRHLEKYAVRCGGGVNHRMGLYDAIMVKDTHIDLLGGMQNALAKLPENYHLPVIVEARSMAELEIILSQAKHKIDRVLLDNMPPALMKQCVDLCQGILPTEASGGINLQNIAEIAATGVNFASIGMLTHSAGNVDLSMRTGIPS